MTDPTTTPAPTNPDANDPAGPLEAHIEAVRRRLGSAIDEDHIAVNAHVGLRFTLGDLRRAAAAIRSGRAALVHAEAELGAVRETAAALLAEVQWLQAEVTDACRESEAVQAMLEQVDNAAHAHFAAVGKPLAFGYNFGAAALGLEAEVKRLRDERDSALRMFAKARHLGHIDHPPERWVALGRRMAGLPPEPAVDEEGGGS